MKIYVNSTFALTSSWAAASVRQTLIAAPRALANIQSQVPPFGPPSNDPALGAALAALPPPSNSSLNVPCTFRMGELSLVDTSGNFLNFNVSTVSSLFAVTNPMNEFGITDFFNYCTPAGPLFKRGSVRMALLSDGPAAFAAPYNRSVSNRRNIINVSSGSNLQEESTIVTRNSGRSGLSYLGLVSSPFASRNSSVKSLSPAWDFLINTFDPAVVGPTFPAIAQWNVSMATQYCIEVSDALLRSDHYFIVVRQNAPTVGAPTYNVNGALYSDGGWSQPAPPRLAAVFRLRAVAATPVAFPLNTNSLITLDPAFAQVSMPQQIAVSSSPLLLPSSFV